VWRIDALLARIGSVSSHRRAREPPANYAAHSPVLSGPFCIWPTNLSARGRCSMLLLNACQLSTSSQIPFPTSQIHSFRFPKHPAHHPHTIPVGTHRSATSVLAASNHSHTSRGVRTHCSCAQGLRRGSDIRTLQPLTPSGDEPPLGPFLPADPFLLRSVKNAGVGAEESM
jgi:hypothetical protein